MSFDLHVLCIMQEKKTKQPPFSSIFTWKVRHRGKNSFPKCYYHYPSLEKKEKREYSYWSFMNSCCGFWYDLLPKEPQWDSCYGWLEFSDYHSEYRPFIMPTNYCLPDDFPEYISKLETFWIKKKYMRDFEKIIDYFLSESPVGMIIFLARGQGDKRDIVNGVISRNQFFSMMKNKKFRLNMCYIIRK